MPISKVQKWMRGQWPVVMDRASEYAQKMPPDGVSRGRFVADVLTDVDPRFCDQVVEMLGRRGIVWLSRYRGEVTVYGEKPQARGKKDLIGKRPIDTFVADLAPLLLDAASKARAGAGRRSPPEATEALRVAVGRVLTLCERKAADGLSLSEMREAMWSTFAVEPLREIAFYEPRLSNLSVTESFADLNPRKKRLPNGLTPKARVLALVERAGLQGITKTAIQKSVRPAMTMHALAELIGELETEGAIVWGEMRLKEVGRPGVRLFTAKIGLPNLHSDGTMFHREAAPA